MAAAALPHERPAVRFPRDAACRIAGVSPKALTAWNEAAGAGGFRWPLSLGTGGLVALVLLRDLAAERDDGLCAFRPGLSRLFAELEQTRDVAALAHSAVIVGEDFARVCPLKTVHVDCGPQFIVRPLGPIVAELKDLVFS